MDPIADFLTRIRNAIKANHRFVEVPSSNLKKEITRVMHESGFIQNYKFVDSDEPGKSTIKIALKYNPETKIPAIQHIEKISSPGLRRYAQASKLPRVLNGLGVAILSTNRGVMTEKQAKKENVGGEVLCYIY